LLPFSLYAQGGPGSINLFSPDPVSFYLEHAYDNGSTWASERVADQGANPIQVYEPYEPNPSLNSAMTGYNDAAGEHVFFFEQTTVHLYTAYRNSGTGQWSFRDLIKASNFQGYQDFSSNLTSYYDASSGTDNVYLLSQGGHIYHFSGSNGSWQVHDVTTQTGNVPMSQGASLLAFSTTGSACCQRLFFLGSNNDLYYALWNGSSWENAVDLNTTYGVPVASEPKGPLTGYSDASGEHIYFEGTDQDIYDLTWNGTWTWTNISQCHCVPLGTGLGSYSDNVGQHVFFVNGQIYEFLYKNGVWTKYATGPTNLPCCIGPTPNPIVALPAFGDDYVFYSVGTVLYRNLSTDGINWTFWIVNPGIAITNTDRTFTGFID